VQEVPCLQQHMTAYLHNSRMGLCSFCNGTVTLQWLDAGFGSVIQFTENDHLCGLVVRVPGYRSRDPGFGSRRYQIFWEVVGLECGPLSLVSTIEELLGRISRGSSLENHEYGHGAPLRWPHDTLYPQKLALTSPICGGRSVSIVHLQTKTTEFFFINRHYK
jgi:hypothetical protein